MELSIFMENIYIFFFQNKFHNIYRVYEDIKQKQTSLCLDPRKALVG